MAITVKLCQCFDVSEQGLTLSYRHFLSRHSCQEVQRPTRLNLSAEDFELEDSDRKPPILVKKTWFPVKIFP